MTDITGTPGDDLLTGTQLADTILGGEGDDTLMGLGGNDFLAGQGGDDVLNGGSGDDTLLGGAGADTLDGGSGNDLIYIGNPAKDFVDGGSGVDTASFAQSGVGVSAQHIDDVGAQITGIERVVGSDFGDTISVVGGRDGVHVVDGGLGDDALTGSYTKLFGGAGDDGLGGYHATVIGGVGNDTLEGFESILRGGAGDDYIYSDAESTLIGGAGSDTLVGYYNGGDTFEFSNVDRHGSDHIYNLNGSDVVDLSAIDADSTKAGDQAFHLVASLDGHAGEAALEYDRHHNETLLLLDTDGDGVANFRIIINGNATGFTDFVL